MVVEGAGESTAGGGSWVSPSAAIAGSVTHRPRSSFIGTASPGGQGGGQTGVTRRAPSSGRHHLEGGGRSGRGHTPRSFIGTASPGGQGRSDRGHTPRSFIGAASSGGQGRSDRDHTPRSSFIGMASPGGQGRLVIW